jgi:hypothetical protein
MALDLHESAGRLTVDYRGARTNKTVVAMNLFLAVSCSVTVSLVWLKNARLPATIRYECERATQTCRDAYRPEEPTFHMSVLGQIVVNHRGDSATLGISHNGKFEAWSGRISGDGAVRSLDQQAQRLRDFAASSEATISVVIPRGEPQPSRGVLVFVAAFGALVLWGARRLTFGIKLVAERANGTVEIERHTVFGRAKRSLVFGSIRGIETRRTKTRTARGRTSAWLVDDQGRRTLVFDDYSTDESFAAAPEVVQKLAALIGVSVEGS